MEDRHKYRAWHKQTKIMLFVTGMEFRDMHDDEDGTLEWLTCRPMDKSNITVNETIDKWILMQCTGRIGLDEETNKEKLLYEGDIATITSIEYRETHPDLPDEKIEWNYFGVVRYSKDYCSFYLDTKEHGDIAFGKDDEIMIHGNEFDNPELLEEE